MFPPASASQNNPIARVRLCDTGNGNLSYHCKAIDMPQSPKYVAVTIVDERAPLDLGWLRATPGAKGGAPAAYRVIAGSREAPL
jgi:hypothetical protein